MSDFFFFFFLLLVTTERATFAVFSVHERVVVVLVLCNVRQVALLSHNCASHCTVFRRVDCLLLLDITRYECKMSGSLSRRVCILCRMLRLIWYVHSLIVQYSDVASASAPLIAYVCAPRRCCAPLQIVDSSHTSK